MPFLKHDLRLLDGYLAELARTPYFSSELNSYLKQLRQAIGVFLAQYPTVPTDVAREITAQIWVATKYLAGSISKEVPYEVVYALDRALDDWKAKLPRPFVITTALLSDQEFHFRRVSTDFYTLTQAYLGVAFGSDLIQIAMPRLYRHVPLYMTALYHELGHFIESQHQLVAATLLKFDPSVATHIPPALPVGFDPNDAMQIHASHRAEYFSDLFAASYAGSAYSDFLNHLALRHPNSFTHPATAERLTNLSDFLAGRTNPIIDMFQAALSDLGLPALGKRYLVPALAEAFQNIRPHAIASTAEVHGMMEAGYIFLQSAQTRVSPPWSEIAEGDIPRIINDLIEKSIRNRMIVERWTSGAA